MMGPVAYALCAATSLLCFALLLRSYCASRLKLLFWSALCFFFFTVQNIILFADLVLLPQIDLSIYRVVAGFIGAFVLFVALIWGNK